MIAMVNDSNSQYQEFRGIVQDLMDNEAFLRLENCSHHYGVSRKQHCINVAYYSYLMCKRMGLNYEAAARAGLLHDLFYYDWSDAGLGAVKHALLHSRIALKNAQKITELSELEKDIIHMWLCGMIWPRHKEAYVVSMVDKICAVWEASYGIYAQMRLKLAFERY